MITARPQKNLLAAKRYFREHLVHGDYYSEGQTIGGIWFGQGAVRLGLVPGHIVPEEPYIRLCDNKEPLTGKQLTVRQRKQDRRVFTDFVVAPPKSVSIMALVVGDSRIVDAHAASARVAFEQLERLAATRIRRGGVVQERFTGEIAAVAFQHDASRSLDPQLHTHYVVFNATFDPEEERWKALETRRIFDELGYLTEVYRAELVRRLNDLGYRIRPTAIAFEIEGVSEELIQRFSKGRQAILAESHRLEQELGKIVSNNGRAAIAHAIRERKLRHLSSAELRALQRAQLSHGELAGLEQLIAQATVSPGEGAAKEAPRVRNCTSMTGASVSTQGGQTGQTPPPPPKLDPSDAAKAALDFARDHLFERRTVVSRFKLLEEALKHGRGVVTLKELEAELARHTELILHDNAVTTHDGLKEELRLIEQVNAGMGQAKPLRPLFKSRRSLDPEQRAALSALLSSPDLVVALHGAAGTGKTEVLHELIEALQDRYPVLVFAPTKSGVKALQAAGLASAQTVQSLFTNVTLQAKLRKPVLVVDEAGLLSNRQLLALVDLAKEKRGRIILAGDSRQHASIEAGDALRVLEQHSALKTVPLRQIRRQIDLEYRAAIAEFAEGRGMSALTRLEQVGAVAEVPEEEMLLKGAAESYVTALKAGQSALVVCPTWREVDAVNEEIRVQLQERGDVAKKETEIRAHRSLKWTRAQKRDLAGYQPGLVLNFHRSTQTFQAGDSAEVLEVWPDRLRVRMGKRGQAEITRKQCDCFDVAEVKALSVAAGDRLLIQGNRKAAGLLNGQLVTVKRVARDGTIKLDDGQVIPPDFRMFTHGHAVTSQSAQGRTVDHVILLLDSPSQAANEKTLYVGASRGRHSVKILCDSLDTLALAAARPGTRLSASELLQATRQRQSESVRKRTSVKIAV